MFPFFPGEPLIINVFIFVSSVFYHVIVYDILTFYNYL